MYRCLAVVHVEMYFVTNLFNEMYNTRVLIKKAKFDYEQYR